MDSQGSNASAKTLLESFVSSALGLTIGPRVQNHSDLAAEYGISAQKANSDPRVCAAWETDRGPIYVCAKYDADQSARQNAHVLLIEWWLPRHEHHEGWWHCYPNRPREWIKGRGL